MVEGPRFFVLTAADTWDTCSWEKALLKKTGVIASTLYRSNSFPSSDQVGWPIIFYYLELTNSN